MTGQLRGHVRHGFLGELACVEAPEKQLRTHELSAVEILFLLVHAVVPPDLLDFDDVRR